MKKLSIILLLLFASSCAGNVENRGFMFELTDTNLIAENITTKERVLEIMGSPTLTSDLDKELWVYYFEKRKSLFFFKPEVIDRKIMTIGFDNSGTINSIKEFSLLDEQKDFSFDSHFTEVKSKKENIFKELFSNVGKISAQ